MSKTGLVPLSKAVAAAAIDTYSDKGAVEQIFSYWGARELRKINSQFFKSNVRRVSLQVNRNTNTATLPLDFKNELFVGVVNSAGLKVPLALNNSLVNTKYIEEIECEDKCDKCNQSKAICEDLQVTEEVEVVTINGTDYEKKIIKKLYPNGDYYLETSTPVIDVTPVVVPETKAIVTFPSLSFIADLDEGIQVIVSAETEDGFDTLFEFTTLATQNESQVLAYIIDGINDNEFGYLAANDGGQLTITEKDGQGSSANGRLAIITYAGDASEEQPFAVGVDSETIPSNTVSNVTSKEFIANLDLKPCGCIDNTEENLTILKKCCSDVYYNYYAPCESCCDTTLGGYKIFEDTLQIQFDFAFKFKRVYVEYEGFLAKIDGEYYMPEVAFETVVEGIKNSSIKDKKNISGQEKQRQKAEYVFAKANMVKEMLRIPMSWIIDAVKRTPKFETTREYWYGSFCENESLSSTYVTAASSSSDDIDSDAGAGGGTTPPTVINIGSTLVYEKLKFKIGEAGALMLEGQSILVIYAANVVDKTVNIVLDNVPLEEGATDEQVAYEVQYLTDRVIISFNQAAQGNQRYKIMFWRKS